MVNNNNDNNRALEDENENECWWWPGYQSAGRVRDLTRLGVGEPEDGRCVRVSRDWKASGLGARKEGRRMGVNRESSRYRTALELAGSEAGRREKKKNVCP